MSEQPIACTLSPGEVRARRDELLPGLVERARSIQWRDGRVELRFAPDADTRALIDRVVANERQCCAFLDFAVDVSATETLLTIVAPDDALPVLRDLITQPRS